MLVHVSDDWAVDVTKVSRLSFRQDGNCWKVEGRYAFQDKTFSAVMDLPSEATRKQAKEAFDLIVKEYNAAKLLLGTSS